MKNLLPTLLFPTLVFAGDSLAESPLVCTLNNSVVGNQLNTFKQTLENKLEPQKEEYELDRCKIELNKVSEKTANITVRISYKTKEHGLGKFRWDGQAVAKYPATYSENEWIVLDTLAVVSSEQKPTLGGWEPDRETPVNDWFNFPPKAEGRK